MMMTHNMCVEAGKANGTTCTSTSVILKPGESTFLVDCPETNCKVRGVWAGQVSRLNLVHDDPSIEPNEFYIEPQCSTGKAKWPVPQGLRVHGTTQEMVPMKITQLPIVRNTGTTGHKLQGKTVSSIYVYHWNYAQNWPYLVLSRSKTMKGVYMREKLSEDSMKYAVPSDLPELMHHFQLVEFEYSGEHHYDVILESYQTGRLNI